MTFFLEGIYVKIGSIRVLMFSFTTTSGFWICSWSQKAYLRFFSSKKHVVILFLGSREITYLLDDGCANYNTINFPLLLLLMV